LLIALICDTHFGCRSDSIKYLDYQKEFLDSTFFPTLRSRNITTLIHLGDLVDKRKGIHFNTASRLREDFLNPLKQLNIETHIICGNHDSLLTSSNKINALNELVHDKYNNITVYEDPFELTLDKLKIQSLYGSF